MKSMDMVIAYSFVCDISNWTDRLFDFAGMAITQLIRAS